MRKRRKKEERTRDGNGIRESVVAPDTRIDPFARSSALFSLLDLSHTSCIPHGGPRWTQASHCCCF